MEAHPAMVFSQKKNPAMVFSPLKKQKQWFFSLTQDFPRRNVVTGQNVLAKFQISK